MVRRWREEILTSLPAEGALPETGAADGEEEEVETLPAGPLRLAVVGRPNMGNQR